MLKIPKTAYITYEWSQRYEEFLHPDFTRMSARRNPLGLSKSTFNRVKKELKANPYSRKKVNAFSNSKSISL